MDNRKMIYLDDAIDALERKKYKKVKGDIGGLFYNEIIQNDIDALMQLPAVQPEQKGEPMNELLELIKHFGTDRDVRVEIHYYKPMDSYEIEMREYDYEHYMTYHVKKRIRVNDLLSAKIPTHEVFVKVLNEMYEELKRGTANES